MAMAAKAEGTSTCSIHVLPLCIVCSSFLHPSDSIQRHAVVTIVELQTLDDESL